MKIELSDAQQGYKESFRHFADSYIVPYAQRHDAEERISEEVLDRLISAGYLGSMLPTSFGGMGLDMVTVGLLNEEIGRGCSAVRSLLTVHGMAALGILRFGTADMKAQWLPRMASGKAIGAFALSEPEAGSNAAGVKTTATRTAGGFLLNGCKRWITMGQIADLFILFAQLDGKPTAFLVEKANAEGLTVNKMNGFLGARGSMIAELQLNDVFVPESHLLGKEGIGVSHVALSCLDYGRYTVAWGCIGTAQASLEASLHFAKEREQFGQPIGSNQLIQKMITEMVVTVKSARLLCLQAGYLKDIGDPDSIMETWNAKYFASLAANQVSGHAVQIHGARGCHQDFPVERYFRDAKINEIIEGSSQMHEVMIANHALQAL
ncbi:hypothetical protein DFQ01_102216 [Paenibacillus cellulosilyticus]|uniref:Acyl-CoA dehydrogenase n=2 Tax=Paenibacillus cellulosilyticus TaxID=375489 RepID=A0A2V2YY99_9BACL|nr:hypothetical protein DFQ01_102216 [Paenibacillus cellulosilyticus]QKS46456.1 acyl-CoA dehydrogenase family protein [Paenibacillus cellulosilyticus]